MSESVTSSRDKLVAGLIAALVALVIYQSVVRIPQPAPGPSAAGVAGPAAARSVVCPDEIAFKIPLHKSDFVADLYGMRYHGNTSNQLDLAVLYLGAWEKHMLYFMRDTLTALAGHEGEFVDVGANVGQHSLFMSKYAKRVDSFEPYQKVLKSFRIMIADNNIQNIVLHPVGLGAKAEKLTFYEPDDANLGTGSFLPDFSNSNKRGSELELVTGDHVLLDQLELQRLDLMKIDIEGFEKPALAGMRKTLEKFRPVVVMEVTIDPGEPRLFKNQDEVMAAFPKDYDYRLLERTQRGMATGEYHLLNARLDYGMKQQQDLVLFPREKRPNIPFKGAGDPTP